MLLQLETVQTARVVPERWEVGEIKFGGARFVVGFPLSTSIEIYPTPLIIRIDEEVKGTGMDTNTSDVGGIFCLRGLRRRLGNFGVVTEHLGDVFTRFLERWEFDLVEFHSGLDRIGNDHGDED